MAGQQAKFVEGNLFRHIAVMALSASVGVPKRVEIKLNLERMGQSWSAGLKQATTVMLLEPKVPP